MADSNEPPKTNPAPRRMASHKLWFFLIIVDLVFLAIFGGTAASKVYRYWNMPEIKKAAPPPKKPPKPAKLPPKKKASAPAKKEAVKKAPEPAKKKPTAKKAPPAAKKATPKKAEKTKKKTTKSPVKKVRARPIEFRFRAPNAKKVQLAGAFLVSSGGKMAMEQKSGKIWSLTIYLKPSETYRYYFIVDGKKTLDPQNPRSSGGASVIAIP